MMNSGFLRFAFERHSAAFSLQCVALIWLHYLTAGLGFTAGLALGKLASSIEPAKAAVAAPAAEIESTYEPVPISAAV